MEARVFADKPIIVIIDIFVFVYQEKSQVKSTTEFKIQVLFDFPVLSVCKSTIGSSVLSTVQYILHGPTLELPVYTNCPLNIDHRMHAFSIALSSMTLSSITSKNLESSFISVFDY